MTSPLFKEILKATLDWPPVTDFTSDPQHRVETPYTDLVKKYENENWIGLGRHRAVFRRGRLVVKVPVCDDGDSDNFREARMWATRRDGEIPIARCRLAGQLLIMEYVRHVGRNSKSPRWADYVDCGQVGRTRKGKLVAYDYA